MTAVWYRMRIVTRRRIGPIVAMTVGVGIVAGLTLTIAAGARRSSTAPDRYTADSSVSFDALVTQQIAGRPRTGEIAGLAGVSSADSYTFVFGGLVDPVDGEFVDSLLFSGSSNAMGAKLVAGRDVDPTDDSEFVASRSFVDATGATLGDRFQLVTLTPEQAAESGFAVDHADGPQLTVTLVGVIDSPQRLDDPTPMALVSPALLEDPNVGIALTMIAIDLDPNTDIGSVRAELDTLADSESLSVDVGDSVVSDTVRRAVATQARGLWLLAITSGIAGIIVVGQVVSRQVRPSHDERRRLAAIGFTSRQTNAEAMARAMVPLVAGAAVGAAIAIASSGLFPVGFVRVVEPHPGVVADWTVMLVGIGIFVVGCAGWTAATLVLRQRSRTTMPSPWVESVAAHASPTAATGLRMAFVRRSNAPAALRGSVIGITSIVVGLAASVTFGASFDRLIREPFRYGVNYDALLGDQGAIALPDGFVDQLDGNADVTSLVVYAGTTARVSDTTTPIIGYDPVRGGGSPYVSGGRLPVAADEIAFGRTTADDLDVGVGDTITLAGPSGKGDFTVTGVVVMPGLGSTDGMGAGGLVTSGGLSQLDADARATGVAVSVRGDLSDFLYAAFPEMAAEGPPDNFQPAAIHNLERVDRIPVMLAGVLAVLGLLSVTHVLATSTRSQRRDLAILRSLGASGAWVERAVHWQATLFTALCAGLGIPLGIVVGRQPARAAPRARCASFAPAVSTHPTARRASSRRKNPPCRTRLRTHGRCGSIPAASEINGIQ